MTKTPLVLVASNSAYRRRQYAEYLRSRGFAVETAENGVQCLESLNAQSPEIMILESTLLWGGTEGILAIRKADPQLCDIPVVLIMIEGANANSYRLADYPIQGFYSRPLNSDALAYSLQSLIADSSVVNVSM
jgi:CheY-like chemotaxis protein